MKICYALLLHHKFGQAARLMNKLAAPGVSFAIHVDKKVTHAELAAFKNDIANVPDVSFAPRVRARWGSYRQALAIIRVIQQAARLHEFDRCVLLSGQDYPVVCHADIVAFFAAHPQADFVEAGAALDLADAEAPGWSPHYRFRRIHVWFGQRRFAFPKVLRPMPPVPLFHGATWWALTSAAMHYVADRFESDTALRRYLRTGFLVDEVYVPTLLMSSPFASRVTGQNLTFAQWAGATAAHPKTLGLGDLADIRSSGKLFARKFDPDHDEAVMRALDVAHAKP